ncbi:MAG: Leucine-tRNA ligase, partial [Parcubacteria group bacterium GW2011_GWB1_41_4]
MTYDHSKIEKKWQKIWQKNKFKSWQARNLSKKKKFYILDMFPYPSGDGLHVGHIEGYTATDIYSRYLRMNNYNVLHPMGFDAFGLPAENYAINNKVHPASVTEKNIKHFHEQMEMMGLSYDWSRDLETCDPEYYKWTQWIVLQMFHRGLAYQSTRPINWCPSCKTGLANEDLEDGKCERCKSDIIRQPMRQWFLKITDYADRLLEDLKDLDWPEGVKEMQKNWIGKSHGYEFDFSLAGREEKIGVFTTRLDTIFGATFLVLAPEYPLLENLTLPEYRSRVLQYIAQSKNKTDLARETEKEKTGVFTGSYAINPANQKRIPIWVADYVMMGYGTGAVMGVSAHDERDFTFAKKFGLEIIEVISPDGKGHILDEAYTDIDSGTLINSGPFDRTPSIPAQEKIANFIGAKKTIHYKLEDWGFDRQRYWGEPMPLIFCENCKKSVENSKPNPRNSKQISDKKFKIKNREYSLGEIINPGWVGLKEKDLPLTLPKVKYYEPTGTGESPLANIESWVKTKCPKCGFLARRETNTMPQWAGSCWYYLAFALGDKQLKLKGKDVKKFWNQKILKYWKEVDFYVGGVEHATRHLIYARFWHKFLFDLGILSNKEPFAKLVNQGLILGPDGEKMSKSRGNVVNPDEIVEKSPTVIFS